MRSRERLIEVLESVNPNAVGWFTKEVCIDMRNLLKGHTVKTMCDFDKSLVCFSPHIRELLSEGLQILAAEKLVGGCRND